MPKAATLPQIASYSRLKKMLEEKKMTVMELYRKMRHLGVKVNPKTLYRLQSDAPVKRLDMNAATAICQVLHVQLGELIQIRTVKITLQRLPKQKQQRLDELMDRNNEGQLSKTERAELEALVEEGEALSLANTRMLVEQKRRLSK